MEQVIASPRVTPDDAPYKRNGKPSKHCVVLDSETTLKLKERFGNIPLGRCIRSLLKLPPLEKVEAWQEWEDNIIRECYPWGGSLSVKSQDINRTYAAIREQARKLGIRRECFRPQEDWLTLKEVSNILGCHSSLVYRWCKRGYIEPIKLKAPIKHLTFITQKALIAFIKQYPFVFPHEKLHISYRSFLSQETLEWVTTHEASKLLFFSVHAINNYIDRGHIPVRKGFRRQRYVKIKDIQNLLQKPPRKARLIKPLEWKLWENPISKIKHLIVKDEEGDWYKVCQGYLVRPIYTKLWLKYGYRLKLSRGCPTCKICKEVLRKHQPCSQKQ